MVFVIREVVFEESIASQVASVEVVDMPYEHLQQSQQGDKQQGYLIVLQSIRHGDEGEESRHCELHGNHLAALSGDIMRVEETAEREAEADAHQIEEDDIETGHPVVIFRPASGKEAIQIHIFRLMSSIPPAISLLDLRKGLYTSVSGVLKSNRMIASIR